MPRGRGTNMRGWSRVKSGFRASTALVALAPALGASPAVAAGIGPLGIDQVVFLSTLAGVVTFAVIAAVALMRARQALERENVDLKRETADLKSDADRAEAIVASADERVVAWDGGSAAPLVAGAPKVAGMPDERAVFLAFGSWLAPSSAATLDKAISRLRERGEPFSTSLESSTGSLMEVTGRSVAGRAVVRFRDLSGDRLELAALEERHARLRGELEALRGALELAGIPAWRRDAEGTLAWVNAAYARAVEAPNPSEAVKAGAELLASDTRDSARQLRAAGHNFAQRATAIVRGDRRVFDVVEVAGGSGLAIDVTEAEAARASLDRTTRFHAHTLDNLAAGVAVFGLDRRLRSYNSAYRDFFGLDVSFLESQPEQGEIIDRLRAARKLPEQADFRGWKADLLAAYQSVEAREWLWVLPDRQMLRVVSNPHPEGGVTWIYENVTERLDLESRFNALTRVQGETLDNLAEAVAVFGSDGRLRLHNPAFARIWQIDKAVLANRPHINEVAGLCRRLYDDADVWRRLTGVVAGVDETRSAFAGRMDGIL